MMIWRMFGPSWARLRNTAEVLLPDAFAELGKGY